MPKCKFVLRSIGIAMETDPKAMVETFFNAVRSGLIDKMVELLENKVVKVDVKDEKSENETALHIAAYNGNYEMARILVDKFNAPVNIADKNNQIPLQIATDEYNMKIVKFLLKRNSDMREYAEHQLNDSIVDELFEAAESNDIPKVVALLKEKKIDVNIRDKSNNNRVLLHIAASNGNDDLVRTLIEEFGANVYREDDLGDTAYHMALDNDHPSIGKLLMENGYVESAT